MRSPAGYAGITTTEQSSKKRSPSDGAIPAPPIVVASSGGGSVPLPIPVGSQGPDYADRRSPSAERQASSVNLLEIKEEVVRLQEREAALSHMLSLEKEQRVKAEQLVEMERMACLELKHRLHLQTKGEEVETDDDIDFDKLSDDIPNVSTQNELYRMVCHLKATLPKGHQYPVIFSC